MKKNLKGFTLVELVITIAIVIILSVVSVPIYRGYTINAKFSEGYALLGMILSAQKAYYSQYGNFLRYQDSSSPNSQTAYETVFDIDARGNKYFTWMDFGDINNANNKIYFESYVLVPPDLRKNRDTWLGLQYNITKGAIFMDWPSGKKSEWVEIE